MKVNNLIEQDVIASYYRNWKGVVDRFNRDDAFDIFSGKGLDDPMIATMVFMLGRSAITHGVYRFDDKFEPNDEYGIYHSLIELYSKYRYDNEEDYDLSEYKGRIKEAYRKGCPLNEVVDLANEIIGRFDYKDGTDLSNFIYRLGLNMYDYHNSKEWEDFLKD